MVPSFSLQHGRGAGQGDFRSGEMVLYKELSGEAVDATIIGVHHDCPEEVY